MHLLRFFFRFHWWWWMMAAAVLSWILCSCSSSTAAAATAKTAGSNYHHHLLLRRDNQYDHHNVLLSHNLLRHDPLYQRRLAKAVTKHGKNDNSNNNNDDDALSQQHQQQQQRKLSSKPPVHDCIRTEDCPDGLICAGETSEGTVVGNCAVPYCEDSIECPENYICHAIKKNCCLEGDPKHCPSPCTTTEDCPIRNCHPTLSCPQYTCKHDLNTNVCRLDFLGRDCDDDRDCEYDGQDWLWCHFTPLWCHPTRSVCVECRSDQDCTTTTTTNNSSNPNQQNVVCELESGVCKVQCDDVDENCPIPCTTNEDCPLLNCTQDPCPPYTCDLNTNVCVQDFLGQVCETDSDCQQQQQQTPGQGLLLWCHPELSVCVECRSDQDCTCTGGKQNVVCELEKGVCVENPYCDDNGYSCGRGTFCDPVSRSCKIHCETNEDCPIRNCVQEPCPPYTCDLNTTVCVHDYFFGQACETDSNCQQQSGQGSLLWCHPESLVCVECRSDEDCTGSIQSVCELDKGVCVEKPSCAVESDCPEGTICDPVSRSCIEKVCTAGESDCTIPCETNEDCPVIQCNQAPCPPYTCDLNTNLCVQDFLGQVCETDSDCQQQPGQALVLWCHPEFSVCVECRSDEDCTGSIQSVCELDKGVCVEDEEEESPLNCTNKWDCPNGYFCNAPIYFTTPPCSTTAEEDCSESPHRSKEMCDEATGYCSDAHAHAAGDVASSSSSYGQCEPILCTSDEDCGGQWVCDTSTQMCVPIQCPSRTTTCPNGLLCHTDTGMCVSCLLDDNCDFGFDCSPTRHECVPSEPEPRRCQSNMDCPVPSCSPGTSCPFIVCDLESGQCINNNTFGEVCSNDEQCRDLFCNTTTTTATDPQATTTTNATCVYCTNDDHCIEIGFICNTFDGECVLDESFCRSDEDCPIPPCQTGNQCPVLTCEVETGRCVDVFGTTCSTSDNCRGGLFCDSNNNNNSEGTGICVYCTNDDECKDNLLCNKESGYCVACLSNTDCDDGMECDMMSGKCVVSTDEPPVANICSSDEDCGNGTTCNTTTWTCTEDATVEIPDPGCVPNKGSCEAQEDCCKPDKYGCFGKKQGSFKCLKCAKKKMNCDTDEDCCGGGSKVKCHKRICEKCGKARKSCKSNKDCCSNSCEKKNRNGKRKCA